MDDIISKAAAIQICKSIAPNISPSSYNLRSKSEYIRWMCNTTEACTATDIEREINKLPAVNAAPVVHGRWIDENPDDSLDPRMRCSICAGIETPLIKWRYCPNCGAKMENEINK